LAIDSGVVWDEKTGAEQLRAPESRIGLESSGCVTARDPVTLVVRQEKLQEPTMTEQGETNE
jgi:hypothetical protein